MNLLSILLQTPAGGSQWSGILMMVVIVAIFYFFMIRPQRKIKEIGDTYMLIEVADGVRIRVDKTSIFASAEDAQQQK